MNPGDELVSFEKFHNEIEQLGMLLAELNIEVAASADIERQTYDAFAALYYSIFTDDRPTMNREDEIAIGAALAGLGDLAAKINRARRGSGFDQIMPHLAKMVKGAVRMNAPSQVTDEAANKNSELYVGCLAIGAGLSIELEDPDKSANGKNPDVLLTFEGSAWSVAVKASHSSSAPTIFGNIKKGVEQIERSGANGVVFVNVKNIIDHQALALASPFTSVSDAVAVVGRQVDAIIQSLLTLIVPSDWEELFSMKKARPLVALMGQITVSAYVVPGTPMFVPVKVMRVLCAPPTPIDPNALTGADAAAWRLLQRLNHELQRNAGSSCAIGGV
jgi:hypothetical protein